MKNITFYFLAIALLLMTTSYGCEKAEVQRPPSTHQVKLELRGDCEECPDNDQCCCAVWLKPNDDEAMISICGSTNGTSNCSGNASGNCPAFNGFSYSFHLSSMGTTFGLFCSLVDGPFWISNSSSTDPAGLVITCQNDILNPDTIHITIPPSSRLGFRTNEDCEVNTCN